MTVQSKELMALRADLGNHVVARGKRYEPELRDRVTRWARTRREQGVHWREIADELGLNFETVRRWAIGSDSDTAQLLPVHVVERAVAPPPRSLVLVSPSGYRVEELSLVEAVAMLRALS
jgi:hypothetical protein